MAAYYNENDPYAAQWLRNLIKAGHIAPGEVDERSIEDVRPDEIQGFAQCHFFAGIGVWSYALRKAGWPDDKPVWTGSCPCQPFSQAGKGGGVADERHLWPAFHWLIQQCRPGVIFGEQVASKDGLAWLDIVQTDLENTGYASGAVDLCVAGVGAPHIRQRLWFVAERVGNSIIESRKRNTGGVSGKEAQGCSEGQQNGGVNIRSEHAGSSVGRMADSASREQRRVRERREGIQQQKQQNRGYGTNSRMADSDSPGPQPGRETTEATGHGSPTDPDGSNNRPGPTNGFWRNADWLGCRDGKWRAVEPGTSPLANGVANRVGRLRAYGNAINAEAAKEVIMAYTERSCC